MSSPSHAGRPRATSLPSGDDLSRRSYPPDRAGRGHLSISTWLLPPALLALLLGVWCLLASRYPSSVVPWPLQVWSSFVQSLRDGIFLPDLATTAEEAFIGWAIGSAVALPLGYIIGRVLTLERALAPYLASSQAIPIIAIAPLLVQWTGFGLMSKVVVAGLITFFPVMATTAFGIRSIDRDLRDVARVFGAGWRQTLFHLELPAAARSIFAGEKIAAALAVTGAVVGEYVGASQGLGYRIEFALQNFDMALAFVGLVALMSLGAAAYAAVSLAERMVVTWTD